MWLRADLVMLAAIAISISGFALASDADKYRSQYIRPATVPHPSDNALTHARADLGKTLFFDPRLSASDWISCATCHNPGLSWGDGLPKAIGHGMKVLERRTQTVLNLAWGELFMWDGRFSSLEEQALAPIEAVGEMNLPISEMLKKLQAVQPYKALFEKAYPGEGITDKTVAKALAVYQRTLVSGIAPFDRWVSGDKNAISASAKRGFVIFNEKGLCAKCHSGWRFTDDSFHDIGVSGTDLGRGHILPDIDVLKFAFKTPTLRNVDHRGPYMHDGSEKTLADVVDFYNEGGRVTRPSKSEDIRKLGLTDAEKKDLIEFMHALTSNDPPVTIPVLPR